MADNARNTGRGTTIAIVLAVIVVAAAVIYVIGGFGETAGDPGTPATDVQAPPVTEGAVEPQPPQAPD